MPEDTVLDIPASRPNAYSGSPLDRASNRREDATFIEAAISHPDTLFAPVWRARSLMRRDAAGAPQAVLLTGEAASAVRMAGGPWAFLGLWDGRPVFAVDCSAADDPLPLLPADLGEFTDLRAVAGQLPPGEASVLAHARGLMHWRTKHRYCGVCGGNCEPRSAGNAMQCTQCGTQHFPRTDPAVIMLVIRQDRELGPCCLLGHSTRFPNSVMYSTLAGFVEPGESLEEAVRREVLEETGVSVGRVHYHSSQPWPFPASIMLGFHAEAVSERISIDPEELRDARWFTLAQLRDPEANGFALPRLDSIARRLIEDWMEAMA
ncbi:NAD(+) diphosphatase [Roseomonas sp. NAR14]|uniref:NAD(+) diphosphatase n=1 Tax=Roseomonas acroporae TaxID=2937791 RepID=A0A9X1Y5M9_9PROT|nr:NAD(+) diphosphatase [Roseomonas acroporae]MCK8783903.1 NAD(+) diphosphatase [Roseomonas acroporae]